MTAHADAWFSIGASHRVCQDYARAGQTPQGRMYALLSDGCSGSPDTDVGARLWLLGAEWLLRRGAQPSEEPEGWLIELGSVVDRRCAELDLPARVLDATVGWVVGSAATGWCNAGLVGDGVICFRRRTGEIDWMRVLFLPGDGGVVAPYYLSYSLESERRASYLAQGHGHGIVERSVGAVTVTERFEPNPACPTPGALVVTPPIEVYDVVAVFSDGVESFQREVSPKKWEPVPVHEVLAQLMAIKSSTGAFVERRCRAFEERFCREQRWRHLDDLSMAAVWTGDAPAEER